MLCAICVIFLSPPSFWLEMAVYIDCGFSLESYFSILGEDKQQEGPRPRNDKRFRLIWVYTVCQTLLSYNMIYKWHIQWTLVTTTVFVPKDVVIKWIICCKESLMSRLISKKGLVLFLFPHRTHVLDICENRLTEAFLTNIQNTMLL